MKNRLLIVAIAIGIGGLIFGLFCYFARGKKTTLVTNPALDWTPPTTQDVSISTQPVSLREIISETTKFSGLETNTEEDRKLFCIGLFKEAGYNPVITNFGDVLAIREGRSSNYVAVGAHYDKVDGPSKGILDNMLGCVVISNIAEVFRDEPTDFTYLFLCYTDEEVGKKIGTATSGYRSGQKGRPTYVIEVDYIGDKRSDLGGRYLSPIGGRYLKAGIKITTYPMPEPPTIHTERDNITNVDFDKAYLAYQTVIALIEGIEKGEGLRPPDTVHFWRKNKPLPGLETPQTVCEKEK